MVPSKPTTYWAMMVIWMARVGMRYGLNKISSHIPPHHYHLNKPSLGQFAIKFSPQQVYGMVCKGMSYKELMILWFCPYPFVFSWGPGESGSTKSYSYMLYDKNGHARTMFYLYFLLILISLGNEIYYCYCLTPGNIRFMIDIICSKNEINSHVKLK